MQIVEIKELPNGGHRNQGGNFNTVPDGWAVLPNELKTLNFPFGKITAEEVDGVMTVTDWQPLPVPDSLPEPELQKSEYDEMAEAIEEGVNSI